MTVPRVCPVSRSATLRRSTTRRALPDRRPWGPALGLTPSRYQSGETDRRGAITKAGDAGARVALFEAAHVMMTRIARWFPLKAWAMRLAGTPRRQARESRTCTQGCCDPAPHVGRRH
jgi:transposase